jgi:hypothetical protein
MFIQKCFRESTIKPLYDAILLRISFPESVIFARKPKLLTQYISALLKKKHLGFGECENARIFAPAKR